MDNVEETGCTKTLKLLTLCFAACYLAVFRCGQLYLNANSLLNTEIKPTPHGHYLCRNAIEMFGAKVTSDDSPREMFFEPLAAVILSPAGVESYRYSAILVIYGDALLVFR